jgi:hypothetical protein
MYLHILIRRCHFGTVWIWICLRFNSWHLRMRYLQRAIRTDHLVHTSAHRRHNLTTEQLEWIIVVQSYYNALNVESDTAI